MGEPTTPTGKRLTAWQPDEEDGPYRPFATEADILAIEAEAAVQERKRLRALFIEELAACRQDRETQDWGQFIANVFANAEPTP